MLFVATILAAVGYTLVYAGVKGDHYKIGGTPVWKEPWLPFIAVFSRRPDLAAAQLDSSSGEDFYAGALAAASGQGAAANSGSSSSSSSSSAPAPINFGALPPPGPGQTYG